MRQFRLRTIMALIVVVAVSIWAGMLIERSRQPPRSTARGYQIVVNGGRLVTSKGPAIPAPAVSGEAEKDITGESRGGHDTTGPTTH
jgi:hypothetical protein